MVPIFCIRYSLSCHFLNNVGTLDASVMSTEHFANALLKYAFHLSSDHKSECSSLGFTDPRHAVLFWNESCNPGEGPQGQNGGRV